MNMPELPPRPGGYQRIKSGTAKAFSALRRSQAAQKLSDNVALTIAVVFFLLAGFFVVIGGDEPGSDVALHQTAQPSAEPTLFPSAGPSPTGATGDTPTTEQPAEASATPTDGLIGPFPPSASPDEGSPELPPTYPGPNGPIGVGTPPPPLFETLTPTFGRSTIGPLPALPTFNPSLPTAPSAASPTSPGGGRPTATSPVNEQITPTSEDYPKPTSGQAPTNIPAFTDTPARVTPTSPGGATSEPGFPTDGPIETPDDGATPTDEPGEPQPPTETPTEAPPTATATPAVAILRGNLRWTAANSPVRLSKDSLLAAGSTLAIEPGVEVQLAPGASLIVDGTLSAAGTAANPIRFRKGGEGNWGSLVINDGASANFSGLDVRGAGAGGVVVAALGGQTTITNSRFAENRGQILVAGGNLDMQGTVVSGPAPFVANLTEGDTLRLKFNNITNTASDGATGVTVTSPTSDVTIDVQGNMFKGNSGTNLLVNFSEPLTALFQCNSFVGGAVGLSLKSRHPTLDGSRIVINTNSFINHLNYGLAADVGVGAGNNWWGDASGPFEPTANPRGTGDRIGINGTFTPWLQSKPACSP